MLRLFLVRPKGLQLAACIPSLCLPGAGYLLARCSVAKMLPGTCTVVAFPCRLMTSRNVSITRTLLTTEYYLPSFGMQSEVPTGYWMAKTTSERPVISHSTPLGFFCYCSIRDTIGLA